MVCFALKDQVSVLQLTVLILRLGLWGLFFLMFLSRTHIKSPVLCWTPCREPELTYKPVRCVWPGRSHCTFQCDLKTSLLNDSSLKGHWILESSLRKKNLEYWPGGIYLRFWSGEIIILFPFWFINHQFEDSSWHNPSFWIFFLTYWPVWHFPYLSHHFPFC